VHQTTEKIDRRPSVAHPWNHASRLLKIVATILLIGLGVVATLYIWHWPFTQARVTESIETTFPVKVTYAKFHSTYFPHPGCVAEGVQFHWLANKPDAPPIATAASFKIQAHYWDLVLRPGYLAHLIITGLRVDVPPIGTPREPYTWVETSSHIRIGEVVADGSLLQIARSSAPALVFDIGRARLTSVNRNQPFSYDLKLHLPLPPGEVTAHGHFGPWNSENPGSTQLSGDYSFERADLSVFEGVSGMLSSEDHFEGPLQRFEARGSINIPDFSVTHSKHSVRVNSKFHAFINGLNGDVQLEQVDASFLNTKVTAQGTVAGTPNGDGKTALLDLHVTDGRIQDVLRLFVNEPKPPLSGVTSLRAHVVWPPGDAPFLRKIVLTGDFGIAGGRFTKDSTQDNVAVLSDRARGQKPENDSDDDKDNIVSNLSGHVELRNEVATFSDFSFSVPGALAQMHGTYNLGSHRVELHGLLKTDAEFSHMTSGFKSVLLKPFNVFFKKKNAGAVVPAHLVGSYEHPEPGIDLTPQGGPAKGPDSGAPSGSPTSR
jgi:hypothetical protein